MKFCRNFTKVQEIWNFYVALTLTTAYATQSPELLAPKELKELCGTEGKRLTAPRGSSGVKELPSGTSVCTRYRPGSCALMQDPNRFRPRSICSRLPQAACADLQSEKRTILLLLVELDSMHNCGFSWFRQNVIRTSATNDAFCEKLQNS